MERKLTDFANVSVGRRVPEYKLVGISRMGRRLQSGLVKKKLQELYTTFSLCTEHNDLLPELPQDVQEYIVSFVPWFSLV